MARPVVIVTSISFSKSEALLTELAALGVTVIANREGRRLEGEELVRFVTQRDASMVIVGTEPVTDSLLQAAPVVKLVAKYGVGLDNVDEQALVRHGVKLGWTPGVNRRAVAELTLAFALAHFRRMAPSWLSLREGIWHKDGGRQLSDLCFGIVGLGQVGTDVASLLRAFGTRVVYHDIVDRRAVAASLGAESLGFEELLATADAVSLHVPLTPATRHMISAASLRFFRPDTLLINTARGDVTDFAAIIDTLRAGRLGGYAADVFPSEPCQLSLYNDVPHLYVTPHIGGNTREAVKAMGQAAIAHVRAFLALS